MPMSTATAGISIEPPFPCSFSLINAAKEKMRGVDFGAIRLPGFQQRPYGQLGYCLSRSV